MSSKKNTALQPYPVSLAGSLLAAREAVMAPIRPHLRKIEVTDQQWRVLRVLAEAECLDARSVAEQALLHPPTVTRILKGLVDRGLIDRRTDEGDGRRSLITITEAGRQLVADTARETKELLQSYSDAFGEERLENFKQEALALAASLKHFQ